MHESSCRSTDSAIWYGHKCVDNPTYFETIVIGKHKTFGTWMVRKTLARFNPIDETASAADHQ